MHFFCIHCYSFTFQIYYLVTLCLHAFVLNSSLQFSLTVQMRFKSHVAFTKFKRFFRPLDVNDRPVTKLLKDTCCSNDCDCYLKVIFQAILFCVSSMITKQGTQITSTCFITWNYHVWETSLWTITHNRVKWASVG